ncbi:hypothetical protein PAPHI01_0771 [Pancytospora philotis]|nr:hypothetical protein PAPHI01_0771 [Pancytospora philotis]
MSLCATVISAANPSEPSSSLELLLADVERECEAYHSAIMGRADKFEADLDEQAAGFNEMFTTLSEYLQDAQKNYEDNGDYAAYIGYVAATRKIFLRAEDTPFALHGPMLAIDHKLSAWFVIAYDYLELIKKYIHSIIPSSNAHPYKRRDITAITEQIRIGKEAGRALKELQDYFTFDINELADYLMMVKTSLPSNVAKNTVLPHYTRLDSYARMLGEAVSLTMAQNIAFCKLADIGNAVLKCVSAAEEFIDQIKVPIAEKYTGVDGELNSAWFTGEDGKSDYAWFKVKYEASGEWKHKLKDEDVTGVGKFVAAMQNNFSQYLKLIQFNNKTLSSKKTTQLVPFIEARKCAHKSILQLSKKFVRTKHAAKQSTNKEQSRRKH